jgi:hypothetical protein
MAFLTVLPSRRSLELPAARIVNERRCGVKGGRVMRLRTANQTQGDIAARDPAKGLTTIAGRRKQVMLVASLRFPANDLKERLGIS